MHMYEATTASILVRVEPSFVEEQSSPDENYFFWAYTVEIENLSERSVQLRSRFWSITDSAGHTEEVEGPGVVGKEPVIEPGGSFVYTSGAPLHTPSGVMVGHYVMEAEDGKSFDVEIPAFSLDSPYVQRVLN